MFYHISRLKGHSFFRRDQLMFGQFGWGRSAPIKCVQRNTTTGWERRECVHCDGLSLIGRNHGFDVNKTFIFSDMSDLGGPTCFGSVIAGLLNLKPIPIESANHSCSYNHRVDGLVVINDIRSTVSSWSSLKSSTNGSRSRTA